MKVFGGPSLNLTVELQEYLSANGAELFSASLRKDDILARDQKPETKQNPEPS